MSLSICRYPWRLSLPKAILCLEKPKSSATAIHGGIKTMARDFVTKETSLFYWHGDPIWQPTGMNRACPIGPTSMQQMAPPSPLEGTLPVPIASLVKKYIVRTGKIIYIKINLFNVRKLVSCTCSNASPKLR